MNKNINFSSVLNYYELQSYSITNGNGGMNTEFSLVGKVRKTNLLVYFLFAGVFTLIYGLMAYFDGSMKKLIITGIIALVSLVVIFIHYLILTKKVNPNIRQLDFYHRELPSNLKPAHVRMLLNDGLIDELSIAATLLDLIDRGYLSIQGVEKKDNLFEKNTNIIISKTSKDTSDLLRYESFLINWFFFSCNNTPTISIFSLREALNDLSRYRNIVEYKYNKYLDEKYKEQLIAKIDILEGEIKKKIIYGDNEKSLNKIYQDMYKNILNNIYYNEPVDEIENKRTR